MNNLVTAFNYLQTEAWRIKGFKSITREGIHEYTREEPGSRPGLLFLHGLGDTAATWHKMILGLPNETYQKYNVFVPNLPSSMGSADLNSLSDYRMSSLAKRIAEPYIERSPEGLYIVGNSLGGWLSLKIAELYPEHVKNLSLLSPAGFDADYEPIVQCYLDPSVDRVRKMMKEAYYKAPNLPDFILKFQVQLWEEMQLGQFIHAQEPEDFYSLEDYGRIKCPAQIFWGVADKILPRKFSESTHKGISGSEFHILEKCGHLPQIEAVHFILDRIKLYL